MSIIPSSLLKKIRMRLNPARWYDLRTTQPVSTVFGLDRGTPVDRYYIEKFLSENKNLIKGNVLEIAENTYSKKFGADRVIKQEILHYANDNANATIIGDLTKPGTLPADRIDCFICTQTFNFIYDFKAAIQGAYHLLKKGGVLVATLGGISQISRYDMDRWGDFWRFTTLSAQLSFGEVFGKENVITKSYGNVLAAVSFLEGISVEELSPAELDVQDENYQLIITVIATK